MKKKLPIILLGVILACVLVFGFLYANNDIGKTANSLEADIRQSQKILDDWIVDGSISDTMAAFISYPQDKTDHTFSVYVNRPGLSFGYFFRGGGDIVEVDDYIAFCKVVIRHAAIDKILKLRRRWEREVSLDYLMSEKFVQLAEPE